MPRSPRHSIRPASAPRSARTTSVRACRRSRARRPPKKTGDDVCSLHDTRRPPVFRLRTRLPIDPRRLAPPRRAEKRRERRGCRDLAPPFAQELEAKGYSHLAEARAYAPLSFIGLVAHSAALKKSPAKAEAMIAGLLKTLAFMHDAANRAEMVRYIAAFHKIDAPLAEKAFAATLPTLSRDGTKPRAEVEKEIEIYRDTLKVAKAFTPDDLEDLSMLKKVARSEEHTSEL